MWRAIVTSLAAGLLIHAMAATITVGNRGAGCAEASVADIGAALAAARPGDEIRVCPGVFRAPAGGLIVDKPGVRIVAAGSGDSVKVVPKNPDQRGDPLFGFVLIADHVVIRGFDISGFRSSGGGAAIIVGGTRPGDTSHPAGDAEIERNHIHDNNVGVYLWQSSRNQIRHNVIRHSRMDSAGQGIGILAVSGRRGFRPSADGNIIFHNILHHNEGAAVLIIGPKGTETPDLGRTTIRNNRMTDNGPAGNETGVVLEGNQGVAVEGNVCLRNGQHPGAVQVARPSTALDTPPIGRARSAVPDGGA